MSLSEIDACLKAGGTVTIPACYLDTLILYADPSLQGGGTWVIKVDGDRATLCGKGDAGEPGHDSHEPRTEPRD